MAAKLLHRLLFLLPLLPCAATEGDEGSGLNLRLEWESPVDAILRWKATPGMRYQVQTSSGIGLDGAAPEWHNVGERFVPWAPEVGVTLSLPIANPSNSGVRLGAPRTATTFFVAMYDAKTVFSWVSSGVGFHATTTDPDLVWQPESVDFHDWRVEMLDGGSPPTPDDASDDEQFVLVRADRPWQPVYNTYLETQLPAADMPGGIEWARLKAFKSTLKARMQQPPAATAVVIGGGGTVPGQRNFFRVQQIAGADTDGDGALDSDELAGGTDVASQDTDDDGTLDPLDEDPLHGSPAHTAADAIGGLWAHYLPGSWTTTGGTVTSWTDASGRGHHATAAVGAGPTVSPTRLKGRAAAAFDGTQVMAIPDVGTENWTAFVIAQKAVVQNKFVLISNGGTRWIGGPSGGFDPSAPSALSLANFVSTFPTTPQVKIPPRQWMSLTMRSGSDGVAPRWLVSVDGLTGGSGDPIYMVTPWRPTSIAGIGADTYKWQGDVEEIRIYERRLTITEIRSLEAYATAKYGLPMRDEWTVVADGNSLQAGQGASDGSKTTIARALSDLGPDWCGTNIGVGAITTTQIRAHAAERQHPWAHPRCVLVMEEVGNDYMIGGAGLDGCVDNYWAALDEARTAGFGRIVACSVCARGGLSDADRNHINGRLRSEWRAHAEALADYEDDPRMRDATSTTYFIDGTHCTDAGYAVKGPILAAAIRRATAESALPLRSAPGR